MKVKRISIKGWQGIPDLEFPMGSVTVLSGKNASNKTSVIEALKAVLSHNHEPDRVRKGSKDARVEVAFDNGHTYKMKTARKGTQWDFRDENGNPIRRTKELLGSLLNQLSLDPLAFLQKDPKEQARLFTQAVPSHITAEELGVPAEFVAGIDFDQHALSAIGDENSGVYGRIYSRRTDINRAAKHDRSAIASMEAGLGSLGASSDPDTLRKTIASLEEQKANLEEGKRDAQRAADEVYEEAKAKALTEREQSYEGIRLAFEEPIADVSAELTRARKAIEAEAGAEQTRKYIAEAKQRADRNERESEALTEALERLKSKRTELVEVSPIPGLEVTPDGLVF
jgi:hypothetical protein